MINYSDIDVRFGDREMDRLTRKGANFIINWKGKEVKLPKILNGHRKNSQKTETELKKLKLIPSAPPVGYGRQQFNGEIYFLFDIDKTKILELTEDRRLEMKNYRQDLKLRKTCQDCGKVQKYISDLHYRFFSDGERHLSCDKCYEKDQEKIREVARNVKRDFYSYFINKGIHLNILVDENENFDTVYLDFETTGLSQAYDEILQISIIDNNDRVLFYKLCKPIKQKTWDDAMDIHGITPKDVENELPFEDYIQGCRQHFRQIPR
jgi:transcription elongation factor Elf1